jgi:hypothetical protein
VSDYSFSDLISLFVVRELLNKGVTPRTIRMAESYLRRKWKTDRPFVTDEIQTDGRTVFVDDEIVSGQIESADRHGQQVMREVVSDRLARVRYHAGTAESWSPADCVLVDPRVQFGEPVIAGTRVPRRRSRRSLAGRGWRRPRRTWRSRWLTFTQQSASRTASRRYVCSPRAAAPCSRLSSIAGCLQPWPMRSSRLGSPLTLWAWRGAA